MGALGSTGEDLRRHDTCTPAAMAELVSRPMAMVADENGKVASDVGYCHTCEWRRERGHVTWSAKGEGHDAADRRACAGEGADG
jgi:hypothetical protein